MTLWVLLIVSLLGLWISTMTSLTAFPSRASYISFSVGLWLVSTLRRVISRVISAGVIHAMLRGVGLTLSWIELLGVVVFRLVGLIVLGFLFQ